MRETSGIVTPLPAGRSPTETGVWAWLDSGLRVPGVGGQAQRLSRIVSLVAHCRYLHARSTVMACYRSDCRAGMVEVLAVTEQSGMIKAESGGRPTLLEPGGISYRTCAPTSIRPLPPRAHGKPSAVFAKDALAPSSAELVFPASPDSWPAEANQRLSGGPVAVLSSRQ